MHRTHARAAMLWLLVESGCGRIDFDPRAHDATIDTPPPSPLACGEVVNLGLTSHPASQGDREVSAATTVGGGVVVWNTSAHQLAGVGLSLDRDTVGVHRFGELLSTSTNVFAVGVAALGDDVLALAGTDTASGTASAIPLDGQMSPRGPSVVVDVSTQERDNLAAIEGGFVASGVAGGEVVVIELSRLGSEVQREVFPATGVSEAVPQRTATGSIVISATTTTPCSMRLLDAQLAEVTTIQIGTDVCDNPRIAHAAAVGRIMTVYTNVGSASLVKLDVREAVSLTDLGNRIVTSSGTSAQPAWDGTRLWILYRDMQDPADLFALAFDSNGDQLTAPMLIATDVVPRAYAVFAHTGYLYVVYISPTGMMSLTRVCSP